MNFRLVQTYYYFSSLLVNMIDPALAAPTLLAAAKIGCGQSVITPSPTTVIGDLGECDFTGYAESATVVWGPPVNELDGSVTSIAPSHLFRMTGATTPNTVNNVFVTDGVASPNQGILASASITPGIELANVGDGFAVQIGWNLGPASADNEVVIAA